MKRLFKMLSLLSILLILGSCSSSKSINVSTVAGEVQKVKFISLYTTNYPLQYLQMYGGDYSGETYFFEGNEIAIDNTKQYTVKWVVKDNVPTSSTYGEFITLTKVNCSFLSEKTTLTVALGNTTGLFIPTE